MNQSGSWGFDCERDLQFEIEDSDEFSFSGNVWQALGDLIGELNNEEQIMNYNIIIFTSLLF